MAERLSSNSSMMTEDPWRGFTSGRSPPIPIFFPSSAFSVLHISSTLLFFSSKCYILLGEIPVCPSGILTRLCMYVCTTSTVNRETPHHFWFMITILISFLACCASNALAASVRGYVDVISGFRSTSFRDRRLMASAKQPGVNRTVPTFSKERVRSNCQQLASRDLAKTCL